MIDTSSPPTPVVVRLLRWYREGARTALFRPPHWPELRAGPALLALLTLAGLLLTTAIERSHIDGPAEFYWQAAAGGWLGIAVAAWACYLMRPQPSGAGDAGAPGAAHLLAMMLAQSHVVMLATALLFTVLLREDAYGSQAPGAWVMWTAWLLPPSWLLAAQCTLLWRAGTRRPVPMTAAALALCAATALLHAARPAEFWYPAEPQQAEAERPRLALTQETMEAQPALFARRVAELAPQRPGRIDLYAITFAPYAEEDVFRRESDMVAGVMAQRFDAAGRTLQLVNHVATLGQWPWATPLNLKRAIDHVAGLMDKDEDMLFLHLTSHGARDGELAASYWPLSVAAVRPADLKAWLDAAGIRYRIVSISACFSGSWIDPLADDGSLIMTASDADHTSYGCGRRSELTFFGRALYDEQLRNTTLSFEQAHAAAREVIRRRETEAGKEDGYSNPQIRTGSRMQARLAEFEERLKRIGER